MGSLEDVQRTADLVSAWRAISDATATGLELDNQVDDILDQVAEIGFELATVSLVDDYRHVIETFRGWNVPSGWIKRAWHSLDSKDIQADVVRKKTTQRITGWDDRLDRVIFERFNHKNLSRIWVPILDGETVVGTIEAGCVVAHETKVLTEENIAAVERMGRDRGPAIAQTRTFVLLKVIAEKAREVMGANLASVHVFHAGEPLALLEQMPLLMAGAEIDRKDLLGIFRPDDAAMKKNEPVIYRQDGRAIGDEMYGRKVRSIAAFPLSLGGQAKGVLSLYFGGQPVDTDGLEMGKVFARQAELAIRNSLLMKNQAAAAGLAWNLSRFQSVIQAVASGRNLEQVLKEVARNVLYMLDADCVTLYQYNERSRRFEGTPVTEGFFYRKELIHNPISPDGILGKMIRKQPSQFIPDVASYHSLAGAGTSAHPSESRLIEREKIKSYAALVLKAGGPGDEAVGCMFVNYRSRTDFSEEDKKFISALASSAAIAIRTARLHDQTARLHDQVERDLNGKLQSQIKSLQALIEIVARCRDVESDLNTNLRMLLAGVTAGQGVGLSRAMLFLASGDRLVGEMAIGAISRTEAEDIWQHLDWDPSMDFATVLDEAAELSADIKKGGNDSPLSLAVQRISVPLQDGSCAPAHCALSGQPVLVYESQDDPFREKLGQAILSEKRRQTIPYPNPDPDIPEPTFAFVCVPLIERGEKRGRTIGVLMCDNRFLPTEGKIDPECIWDIETFAAVAAMSIENDKLRRDLAERQELENWRFAVGLARHRLKGRPDIMDGAVKTIRDHLRLQPEANIVSAIEDSLRRLVEEIDRVKQTLREFEKFSAPATPDLRPLDLVKLLRDDIHFPSQSDCETELKLPEQALSVAGDKRLLTDVFTELIKNSCDAMAGDNEGCPKKITITAGLEQNSDGKSVVVVEFADTGPGIKAEPGAGKDWIFTPFKTTKEATGGNGLGLAIVAQDIRAHNGTIKFKETGRPGACFELRIPAFESGS